MKMLIDMIMVFVVLTNLSLLASRRINLLIAFVAVQGAVISLIPIFVEYGRPSAFILTFSAVVMILKGIVFPVMLRRSGRDINLNQLVEPFIGYNMSIGLGLAFLLFAMWLGGRLPMPADVATDLAFPAAFMTTLTGFLLIVGRRKAITQVIGYLAAENGIFLFGSMLTPHGPLLVELSILLDLLVGVFVMGIAIHHINREFDTIDVGGISSLKD